jgi:hypothetical protein
MLQYLETQWGIADLRLYDSTAAGMISSFLQGAGDSLRQGELLLSDHRLTHYLEHCARQAKHREQLEALITCREYLVRVSLMVELLSLLTFGDDRARSEVVRVDLDQ